MEIRQLTFRDRSQFSAALKPLAGGAANWILVFASPDWFEDPGFFPALQTNFPHACLTGCSTVAAIGNGGVGHGACVVTAVRLDHAPVCATTTMAGMEDSYAAGLRLAQPLQAAKPRAVLLFAPGMNINGSALVNGLAGGLPAGTRIMGGLAGDNGVFEQTWVLGDGGISSNVVIALALPAQLRVGYGHFGGWKPFGPVRKVTRSKGNILYELDKESALAVYKRYLGNHAADLPAAGLLFPFEMLGADHGASGVIRTILGINEGDGSLVLAGEIDPQGYLRLMHASTDVLVKGAEDAAETTREMLGAIPEGSLALLVSCIGRKQIMGGRAGEEVEAVGKILGSGITMTGFYSFGEISPMLADGVCALHNQTMAIACLSDAAGLERRHQPERCHQPERRRQPEQRRQPEPSNLLVQTQLLQRQLTDLLGSSEAELTLVLDQLAGLARQPDLGDSTRCLLEGLGNFLVKIDESYAQDSRDLELSKRSLELSSAELSVANQLLEDRAALLAEEVKKATAAILVREKEFVIRLSKAAEFRNPETGAHIVRMAYYSELIARGLGWDCQAADMILQAAPMHDVGKVATPDSILLKQGKLTPEEFEVMKQHAGIGWEILKNSVSPVLQLAAEIALSHHEKFDGSGYPRGLSGEAIPLSGRIVAVADVFDALTSVRPYKPAWEIERAVALLRESRGQHFDPVCVDAFLANLDAVLSIHLRYKD